MSIILNGLNNLTDFLIEEYNTKTFLCRLSRKQICDISKNLPNYNEWSSKLFKLKVNELKTQYSLSSNEFSKIINLIKNHREFSFNIGIPMPVREITVEQYKMFIDKLSQIYLGENLDEVVSSIKELIPAKAIAALLAFEEIGVFYEYSETYDRLIDIFKEGDNELKLRSLITKKKSIERIELGMKICNQYQFLSD